MTRLYSTFSSGKKRARPITTKKRNKQDDIFRDKWAPTREELKKAECSVYNSHARSMILQGNKPQHIQNENVPNGATKRKVIYATPLPNPRITTNQKTKKKKAVIYAKPLHPLPKVTAPPDAKKTRRNRLWPSWDSYYNKEESKLEESKSPEGSCASPPRRSPPRRALAQEKIVSPMPYDESNSITSSNNSILATLQKEPPRRRLFGWFAGGQSTLPSNGWSLGSTPPRKSLASAPPPKRKNQVIKTTSEDSETVTSAPVSLDEYVPVSLDDYCPVTQIKVNSDEPLPNGPGLGGRLRNSLRQRSSVVANRVQRKRDEWRASRTNTDLPPLAPEQERQRAKPKPKLFTEISTDENALHQRKHRVQVDGGMTGTIMTMDDTKGFSPMKRSPMNNSPMKPSPFKTSKSTGEEANEVVEVMDLTTMSLEDFTLSFQENSNACLVDVYEIDYPVHKSLVSGTLSIALPQDVFLLVSTQLSLLDEYMARNKLSKTREGDRLLVDSILSILKNISAKQAEYRDTFLEDSFEGCIAAANSFMWMVEKVEEFMELVATKYPHLFWCDTDPVTWMPCQEAKELSSQFSQDAVLAASSEAVCFIMDEIHDAGLSSLLFTPQWEEELVHNEVSVSMTRILERRISVTSKWLEQDYLFHKFVGALVRATICFYMEGIVHKAERLRSARRTLGKKAARKKVAFRNPHRACGRLSDDIDVLQDYFEDIADRSIALARVISKEFSFLSLLVECMLQAGRSETEKVEIAEFVYAMHKETGANFEVTKFFMSDVWLLMGPKGLHHRVEASIDQMHEELRVFTTQDLETVAMANADMNGFKLHEVMFSLYQERIKRERTYYAIAEGAVKQTRRDIKNELKNTELRVKYYLEDLTEDFAAWNGSRPRQAEF